MSVSKAPRGVLSNGICVANFSSPHPFNFEDGNVLAACESDRIQAGALSRKDVDVPWAGLPGVTAVTPKFDLSESVIQLLTELEADTEVQIVLIPFPVLEALRTSGRLADFPKVGTICVKNRETKEIFVDRFCR